MWVRGAAIRPVPPYAVVDREVLDRIEAELAENGMSPKPDLDDAFSRFEQSQAALAQLAAVTLARPLDETALALGYFLTIAVWLGFERAFGARLCEVTDQELEAAQSALRPHPAAPERRAGAGRRRAARGRRRRRPRGLPLRPDHDARPVTRRLPGDGRAPPRDAGVAAATSRPAL